MEGRRLIKVVVVSSDCLVMRVVEVELINTARIRKSLMMNLKEMLLKVMSSRDDDDSDDEDDESDEDEDEYDD